MTKKHAETLAPSRGGIDRPGPGPGTAALAAEHPALRIEQHGSDAWPTAGLGHLDHARGHADTLRLSATGAARARCRITASKKV